MISHSAVACVVPQNVSRSIVLIVFRTIPR